MEESLSPNQLEIVRSFESGKNLFITGGAGTGKSFLLNYLKTQYSKEGLEVTASTGIAAINIGGLTIHSWSGIGLGNMPIEKILDDIFSPKFTKVRKRILKTRALAIDEISMISADVLDLLDEVFRAVRQNDSCMGGLQILFFGDFLQLPPISKFSNDTNFCFESGVWQDLNLESFVLSSSFRQQDQRFVKILNNLRFGQIDQEDIDDLTARVGIEDDGVIRPTILTTHNHKVEKINQEQLKNIAEEEHVFKAKYYGDKFKIENLKKNCIAPEVLKLKIGAQVMMTKNTYQKDGVINGSLGRVVAFSGRKNYPVVDFAGGVKITVSPEDWLIEKFDQEKQVMIAEAGVSQIPLNLAWAITIHKSQGLTLDKILCDLSDVFSPGQAYVALSRCRSLDGVFIEKINFNKIFCDENASNFYKRLNAIS